MDAFEKKGGECENDTTANEDLEGGKKVRVLQTRLEARKEIKICHEAGLNVGRQIGQEQHPKTENDHARRERRKKMVTVREVGIDKQTDNWVDNTRG